MSLIESIEQRLPQKSSDASSFKIKPGNDVAATPKYMTDTKGKVRRRNSTLASHDFGDDLGQGLDKVDQMSNQVSAQSHSVKQKNPRR